MRLLTKERLFLIIGFLIFAAFVIFLILSLSPETKKKRTPTANITPAITQPVETLKIIKVEPQDFVLGGGGKMIFYFSDNISPSRIIESSSIKYAIKPEVKTRFSVNELENSLTITPVTVWEENLTYRVILDRSISSLSGISLGEDKEYIFTVKSTASL